MNNTLVRQLGARAVFGSTEQTEYVIYHDTYLKSFEISRVGDEGKFFGFGITQRLNLKVLKEAEGSNIYAGNKITLYGRHYTGENTYLEDYLGVFYITEVNIDAVSGEYSITAYDILHKANNKLISEISITAPYTAGDMVDAIASYLGCADAVYTASEFSSLEYEQGFNIEGTEKISEILDDIAEATQTFYYVDYEENLIFKRLDYSGDAELSLTPNDYYELKTKTNRRLARLIATTQLGENYEVSSSVSGSTQYVRDNCLWENRDDIQDLIDNAFDIVEGATIGQFEVKWRGLFEQYIGAKIAFYDANEDVITTSFVINETIAFNGSLEHKIKWEYADNEEETAANPITLGEVAKQTYAKVDKVNKQVDIVVSDVRDAQNNVSSLQLTTTGLNAAISSLQSNVDSSLENINTNINTLTNQVNARLTSEQVALEVSSILEEEGVSKITTTTGFTFDKDGITINKTGSEMTTNIDEDGMSIYRDNTEVLTADNTGVQAFNLHANTYLIIGEHSRFEDYNNGSRTGCFWI